MIKTFYEFREQVAKTIRGDGGYVNYQHAVDCRNQDDIDHINFAAANELVCQALENVVMDNANVDPGIAGEKLKLIVQLTLAKLDIIKLKHEDAGYLWSMMGEQGRSDTQSTLLEIESLLLKLKGSKENETH